jgi:hypothetical protein
VKLAVVVQRYGADISGGAELHARYVAEMLARRHRVEVLTTCPTTTSWKAHYAEGTETSTACPFGGSPSGRAQAGGVRAGPAGLRRPHSLWRTAWLEARSGSPSLLERAAPSLDFASVQLRYTTPTTRAG